MQQADIDPLAAANFIRDIAPKIAKVRSERVYMEEYRKTLKSKLMARAMKEGVSSLGDREAYAYAHPEYEQLLKGLAEAVDQDEKLRWQIVAAQAKIEIWRSAESSRRAEMAL